MNARFLTATFLALIGTSAARTDEIVKYKHLNPFTHIAYIPADANLSSIRVRSIRQVNVDTKLRATTDVRYCNQHLGQSMFCPKITSELPAPAYEVTYSYRGQPLASDDVFANTAFTFSVYFRPDEISPKLRQAISSGKISRNDLAELFHFTISRPSVQQLVIDRANSSFCPGRSIHGYWVHTDPRCRDRVAHKKMAVPSPYVAVQVAPV